MREAYEEVIQLIEAREVDAQTDALLQNLGEELQTTRPGRPAFQAAVDFLVQDPATDPSATARFHRLCRLCGLPSADLDHQIERLIDLIFSRQLGIAV